MSGRHQRAEALLLPFAAILETGNHIGKVKDGNQRRAFAETMVRWVRDAIEGRAPFVICKLPQQSDLARWIDEFPDWAQHHSSGLGDLAIRREWQHQCAANRRRRVYVWSKDHHLSGMDRNPE